jgi:H+/gluconate symporter-like permease
MGILGIVLSLAGLMYFAYRGINVLVLAPIMALFATLFDANAPIMASYTQVFMPALGAYLLNYFPLFLLGAIFGQLMGDSGAAHAIGASLTAKFGVRHAPLAVVLSCGLLTYGGVSLFVVAFCIYPIARTLFQDANIPKRFIPACIALGSFTFTMTALPGTPAIQNAIPMPVFGTTAFAAPGLGLTAAVVMFFGGMSWLSRRIRRAQATNEGYGDSIEPAAHADGVSTMPLWTALLPLILVVVLNYVFATIMIPRWDTSYLSTEKFGATQLDSVLGLWSIIVAITIAICCLLVLQRKRLPQPVQAINKGTMGSLLPIFNTASEVGYGATISSLVSFAIIRDGVVGLFPQWPLISESISINLLAGITGSASGGLSIALEALGESYLAMAEAASISPELLHRVATLASGGFDTLPHNGAVITLLAICGLTHRQSYLDIFAVAVVVPFVATVGVVLLGTVFGTF